MGGDQVWGKMGGKMGRCRHIISYSLSPFEQRAMAGIVSHGIPNFIRRFTESFPYVAPGLIGAFLIYHWGKKKNAELQRKNPADFANDE